MEYKELKESIKDMESSKLESLEIDFPDGTKIRMKKNSGSSANLERAVVPRVVEESFNIEESPVNKTNSTIDKVEEMNCNIIKSPMVGTFYTSSSPDKPVFVRVGDKVKKGDTLCIIEAMKLMNEIQSEFDGEIVDICVENEAMVDYGKPLFKIK